MRTLLKNSLLVSVLAGIFILPMFGFGFIEYSLQKNEDSAAVLGVQNISNSFYVVGQVDLSLSLSNLTVQKFYNVISEEFLSDDFGTYVVYPKELANDGFSFEVVDNGLSKDLIVKRSGDLVKPKVVDIAILVMRAAPFKN